MREDDFLWKKTFDGRQPLMEDTLRWKTTFNGRLPPKEDDLRWKMTSHEGQLLLADNL